MAIYMRFVVWLLESCVQQHDPDLVVVFEVCLRYYPRERYIVDMLVSALAALSTMSRCRVSPICEIGSRRMLLLICLGKERVGWYGFFELWGCPMPILDSQR